MPLAAATVPFAPSCPWGGGRFTSSEDIFQIREGLVPVQARRLDQAHDRRRPLAGAQRAGEEPILAVMLNLA